MRVRVLFFVITASLAVPMAASGEPLLFNWTSTVSSLANGDVLEIGGSTFTIRGEFDSSPTTSTTFTDFIDDRYTFSWINGYFTDRLGGAPDIVIPLDAFFNVTNMIDSSCGSACADRVAFGGTSSGGFNASLSGTLIRLGSIDQIAVGGLPLFNYFPGNGSLNPTFLNTTTASYGLSISNVSVTRVAEPSTMILFGLGAIGVGWARRRRRTL